MTPPELQDPGRNPNDIWREQGRRLRQARLRKGFQTALEASEHLEVPVGTYRNHERGVRSMIKRVERYASHLAVTPEWLLWGREGDREPAPAPAAAAAPAQDVGAVDQPKARPLPVRGAITADIRTVTMHIAADHTGRVGQDPETIELPAGAPADADVILIRGDGLRPTYDDGMVLLYWNREVRPRSAVGANCAVALRGGPTVLARIEPGPRVETWTLFNVNGTGVISYDIKIEWAAPIEMVLRSTHWHEVWPGDPTSTG
jgi:hypothetical protein